MDNDLTDFFQKLYKHFNERKVELVLASMGDQVKWANGMDGGFVYGQDAVRVYWTRQFTLICSQVTPLKIEELNGLVKIKVHQVVHDLHGKLLADELVFHLFQLRNNKIVEFIIGEKIENASL